MTLKQLERDGWRKMPSVTVRPGGSQHFYYRRNPDTDEREWYLKIDGEWTHRTDDAR